MADNGGAEEKNSFDEKKRIKEEKKKLREEEKRLKKELKNAQELEDEQTEDDGAGNLAGILLMVLFVIIICLAFLCICIRLDVGGFGSGILKPVLRDVPGMKYILPPDDSAVSENSASENRAYGYKDMYEAVARVKELEYEIQSLKDKDADDIKRQEELSAQIARLQEFEQSQTAFQDLKNDYYENVIFSSEEMSAEDYSKYYAEIDEITGEEIYRQVSKDYITKEKLDEYAKAYAAMKPAQAAAIFEAMPEDLRLISRILKQMGADDRGDILAAMDAALAASITEYMDPQ